MEGRQDVGAAHSHARIPSLDGMRALAISAVLIGHLAGTRGFPDALTSVIRNPYFDLSMFGVGVFFVLSGFLITNLLMRESAETGTLNLKQFYLRRTLRIFPAYYVFLFVIAALAKFGWITLFSRDLVHAFTYTMNYAQERPWTVGHLWSLAVEEQFYMLWPAVIAIFGLMKAGRVAVAVILVSPLIRIAILAFFPGWSQMIGVAFETTADALAFGCLLALYREQLFGYAWYRRLVGSRWPAIGIILFGIAATQRLAGAVTLGFFCSGVGTALLIDRYVRRPDGLGGRLLNARPLVWLGGLSYSLYLWQQIFLNRGSVDIATAFPLNILLAFGCAYLSYSWIEQPVLARRPQIEAWARAKRARYRILRGATS